MIRRFPEPALRMLHTFFQTCWTTGNIPKDRKKATVVAIPKNDKPPQQTSSHRPIALTPHLGKVYERVLKNRLDHHLEKNDILPLCQAGFRKGRNCMEHVVRLIEDTKKWSLKGKNKKIVATFFDIKKAFDSVWHAKLLNKIGALGITVRKYNFIQTFLDSREITVKVGPSVSRSHILDMGVPQGSVIAPTLFSIMLHDIMTTLQPQNKPPTLFADDLAIWAEQFGRALDRLYPGCPFSVPANPTYRHWARYTECMSFANSYFDVEMKLVELLQNEWRERNMHLDGEGVAVQLTAALCVDYSLYDRHQWARPPSASVDHAHGVQGLVRWTSDPDPTLSAAGAGHVCAVACLMMDPTQT
ncbi:hypothetical protein ACOMHN_027254 [Nucella lapillus]